MHLIIVKLKHSQIIVQNIGISPVVGSTRFLFGEYILPLTLKILSLSTEEGRANKYFLKRRAKLGSSSLFAFHQLRGFSLFAISLNVRYRDISVLILILAAEN